MSSSPVFRRDVVGEPGRVVAQLTCGAEQLDGCPDPSSGRDPSVKPEQNTAAVTQDCPTRRHFPEFLRPLTFVAACRMGGTLSNEHRRCLSLDTFGA
jgi:hypothetical protein